MTFCKRSLILKKYFVKIIFFLPTDPTLIDMGRWRGNTQYFKSGLIMLSRYKQSIFNACTYKHLLIIYNKIRCYWKITVTAEMCYVHKLVYTSVYGRDYLPVHSLSFMTFQFPFYFCKSEFDVRF